MARSRTPRKPKPKKTVVVVSTIPDADDPRNGFERAYPHFDQEPGTGKEPRRLAIVEYVGVKYEGEFGDGGRELVRIRADRARFPDDQKDQEMLAELLDRWQHDQAEGQTAIDGMGSPQEMREIEPAKPE